MTSYCFDCGGDDRHLRWCPSSAPRPVDFTEPKARSRTTDPSTSYAAAASVRNLSETKRRILDLVSVDPSTDFEIRDRWDASGFPPISDSGLRTRRSELVEDGLLVDSGTVRTGPTGRSYIVWSVTSLPKKEETHV